MANIQDLLRSMEETPENVRFSDLIKVCESYFGKPRRSNGSHLVFKMPWAGDPRINIQDARGKAKPYQVRQVLSAIEKIKAEKK